MEVVTRTTYFWSNGRVVPVDQERPTTAHPWVWGGLGYPENDMIVAISELPTGETVTEAGQACDGIRLRAAMSDYWGLPLANSEPDFQAELPTTVIDTVKEKFRSAEHNSLLQRDSLGYEENITAAFVSNLGSPKTRVAGWEIKIRYWLHSRSIKEPQTNADIGFIFDVQNGDRRIVKATWVQAKRSFVANAPTSSLDNADRQLDAMQRRTNAAFLMVYAPERYEIRKASSREHSVALEDLVGDVLLCTEGDRNADVLIDTIGTDFVVSLVVERAEKLRAERKRPRFSNR